MDINLENYVDKLIKYMQAGRLKNNFLKFQYLFVSLIEEKILYRPDLQIAKFRI